jgi:hypothetical protein
MKDMTISYLEELILVLEQDLDIDVGELPERHDVNYRGSRGNDSVE